MYVVETYKEFESCPCRVLVVQMTSPEQVLTSGENSIHGALEKTQLDRSIGLYFYRFKQLDEKSPAFSKMGVTSRLEGIGTRKKRGWIYKTGCSDSYRRPNTAGAAKGIYADVQEISIERPMYFVYYELDVEGAFPLLEEMVAFRKHEDHFKRSTRNSERVNTHPHLGRKIVWYENAFNEVLDMKLPSGKYYPGASPDSCV